MWGLPAPDVWNPNDGHPNPGHRRTRIFLRVDLNVGDSIVRARYRNSLEHTELMKAGEVYPFTIEMYPTSLVFKKGHRIRLDISSSNFPRFDVNPNTGEPLKRQPTLGGRGEHHLTRRAAPVTDPAASDTNAVQLRRDRALSKWSMSACGSGYGGARPKFRRAPPY